MKIRKKTFLIIVIILLTSGGSHLIYRHYAKLQEQSLIEKRKIAWETLRQKLTNEISQFKGETGIVIKDLQTGWEFSYDKDKLFPSASLTKIPLMAACFLAANEDRLKLGRNIELKSSDKLSGSGMLKNMNPGTIFTVEELIGLMIYDSDNTATNILTNIVGVDYLNNSFNAFGLKNTKLSRKIADYHARDRGIENYTTPEDISFILEQIYRRSLVNKDVSERCLKLLKLQRMNDRISKYLPVDITIAHKTGLEQNVCHDAGLVFTSEGDFLICVLTKHKNPNSVPSKDFIANVALYTYVYFEQLQEGRSQ